MKMPVRYITEVTIMPDNGEQTVKEYASCMEAFRDCELLGQTTRTQRDNLRLNDLKNKGTFSLRIGNAYYIFRLVRTVMQQHETMPV